MRGADAGAVGSPPRPLRGFLCADRYSSELVAFLDRASGAEFVLDDHRSMVQVASDSAALLDRFAAYEPPPVTQWIDGDAT